MSVTLLLAATVVLAGCGSGDLDPASLVGEYRSTGTGGDLVLAEDGTFVATSVPAAVLDDSSAGTVTITGRWEDIGQSHVVYVSIDEISGSDVEMGGVQLYVDGDREVYFHPDVDETRRFFYKRVQ